MRKPGIATIVMGPLLGLMIFCSVSHGEDRGQALIKAVKVSDWTQAKALLDKGTDVNAEKSRQ